MSATFFIQRLQTFFFIFSTFFTFLTFFYFHLNVYYIYVQNMPVAQSLSDVLSLAQYRNLTSTGEVRIITVRGSD